MRPARARIQSPQRSGRLEVRIPAELKDLYSRAAAARGQTLTDFVLSTVTEVARRIVRENDILDLSQRDQLAFAAALTRPPAPLAKLVTVAAWSREQGATDE